MPQEKRANSPAEVSISLHSDRIECQCDAAGSADEFLAAHVASPTKQLVVLRFGPDIPDAASTALLEARVRLSEQGVASVFQVDLPDVADGIAFHAAGASVMRQAADLTAKLSNDTSRVVWSLPLTDRSVFRLDGLLQMAIESGVPLLPIPRKAGARKT